MEQKIRGLLAYLFGWIGGLVVLVAFKDNTKETDTHACQAITLSVTYIVLNIAISIISGILTGIFTAMKAYVVAGIFGFVFGLLSFALFAGYATFAILGMVRAYQEKEHNIPLISNLTKNIFKSKLA